MISRSSGIRAAGFSLIEAMASLAVLTIGILGTAQVQVLAAAQNGSSRRVTVAAAMARDFVETAQRWDYDDPRLAGKGCETGLTEDFPVTDDLLGFNKKPLVKLDFAAAGGGSGPSISSANDQAATLGALTLNGAAYDGRAEKMLGDAPADVYQLVWSVRELVPVEAGDASSGCSAKVVSVAVRYMVGGDRYSNVLATTMIYNPAVITQDGVPERI